MSAAFGQHELWQQHIQMQLQQQQQQQADLNGSNRKRGLATEADEFMGIKKRNLGSEATEQGIFGLSGFSDVSGGANTSTAAVSSASNPFLGLGLSSSTSLSPSANGFLTPTTVSASADQDYFGLPPTSQPNQASSSFFTSRQDSCNSSSAPATPSVSFAGNGGNSMAAQQTMNAASLSLSSTSRRYGWSNDGSMGGAMSNPSTPVTESTARMLTQNSFNLQQMEERQRRTQALQLEEKQSLQRTQQYEQQSLHATQQRELEELQRRQKEQELELARAHHQHGAGVTYDQQQIQQQVMEMDQAARLNNAIHDNNDPATWGYDQSSGIQLRGYLGGQGRGYTPAAMGVAALAAAAAMAQNQRSQQQRPPQLVAPTDQQRQIFDDATMDMDMGDGTDLWTMFNAEEQDAMMQMMMKTNSNPRSICSLESFPPHPSMPLVSPLSSIVTTATATITAKATATTTVHSFSSSSVPLSSSSLSASSTVFPTLGQEPPSVIATTSAISSPSSSSCDSMMINTPVSLRDQGLGHFHHHQRSPETHHHYIQNNNNQYTPISTTSSIRDTNTTTTSMPLSSFGPSSSASLQHLEEQHQNQRQQHKSQSGDHASVGAATPAHSSRSASLLFSPTLLDKPSPPIFSSVSAPSSRPSTPSLQSPLSTSQYQYVMGYRADCERCQRREKGHVAHLVYKASPMR
ncbi:hypothetical protein BGW41_000889 [Actinomortierella wolfii]|nr:hypothetical protein BGW41_000889 [Actinomortierella wolfii]